MAESLIYAIRRQISYVSKYQSYIDDMKNKVDDLRYKRQMVEQLVKNAERQGDEIFEDVKKWLSSVYEFHERVSMLEDECETNNRCFRGLCPNLLKRSNLGKKSEKAANEGDVLLGKGNFASISSRPALQRTRSIYVRDYVSFDSRKSVFQGIMEALKDSDINMIGVYGMGGVGKTTLMKRVAEKVLEAKLFDVVVMAEVTLVPDLKAIQDKIAFGLGLEFDQHETVPERADKMHCRLNKGERVLLILDNIWTRLDLEAVGISSGADDKRRCKMLLTSRSQHVLCNDMNTQKNFVINILSDEEAISLFLNIVGDHPTEAQDFQPLAVEIVRKCGGLPIAIKTIAYALKNKSLFVWEDCLYLLRKTNNFRQIRGMDGNVYSSIKLSYDFLENKEARSLFLLCGLTNDGSRIFIDDLMRYGMGLGLFRDAYSIEATRNRVHALIDYLKASCLLLDGDNENHVIVPNIIHDVAVSLAADHLMFNIQDVADLKEELENKIQKDATAISISFGDIYELPERPEFSKLKLFMLSAEKPSLRIPNLFFEGMVELDVLHLTGFHLPSLPSSLCCLLNLRTLALQSCLLGDVAMVGELRKLEILSFRHSDIKQLPVEIGQLTRLKLLDLSNCFELKVIRPNVISHLSRLEELYMGNSFSKWDIEGQSNAGLVELKQLSRLTTLDIHIPDAQVIPQDLFFMKLERYRIYIGDVWSCSSEYETSRTLKLKLNKSNISLKYGVKNLLKRAEDLYLDELTGFKNVVPELDDEGLQRLKHLRIQNGPEIQYIVNSQGRPTFSLLESLSLRNLTKLEKICHGLTEDDWSFSKLRIINVKRCHSLKHLFSFSMAKNLFQLEEIKVTFCESLETIADKESSENSVLQENESISRILDFTQLHSLTLRHLPQLASSGFNLETPAAISSSKEIIAEDDTEDFKTLFNNKVTFPSLEKLILSSINIEKIWLHQFPAMYSSSQNLTILKVEHCNRLRFLFSSSMVNSLVRLQTLVIRGCELMEGVVDTRLGREELLTTMVFRELLYLELEDLPKLTRFAIGNSIEFSSLTELQISSCPNLERFISSSTCAEELSLEENIHTADMQPFFDSKVVIPCLEIMGFDMMMKLRKIWGNQQLALHSFWKLKDLEIRRCHKLLNIIPSDMWSTIGRLENLLVICCDSIEEIIEASSNSTVENRRIVLPQLTSLKLHGLPKLKTFYTGAHISEWPVLKTLEVCGCHKVEIFASSEVVSLQGPHQEISQQPLFLVDQFAFPSLEELQLSELPEMLHLWKGNSHPCKLFRNLETLEVSQCSKLEKLVPPSVLFQNLMTLKVSSCDRMKILVTFSTAKSLVKLIRMDVFDCKMIEQIIQHLGEEVEVDSIAFSKLEYLGLDCLPSLASFCVGNYTLEFPYLEHATVRQCPKMKIFSQGVLYTPKLRRLQLTEENDDEGHWEGDLNTTLQKLFKKMDVKSSQED